MTSMAELARPWRCFWDVPLPETLRAELQPFVADLRRSEGVDEAWRFADADGWHVTLAFLGGIDPSAIDPMVSAVRDAVAGFAPFEVRADGLGGFPGRARARVMWYGVEDVRGQLAMLAGAVREAAGADADEPFRPHLTLGRSRDRRGAPLPEPVAEPPHGAIPVADVRLKRSHLGQGPARYEEVARVALAPRPMAIAR
jgi:2'-5' RNA ligase